MSNIGHNKPPLDPKETILNNINRKTNTRDLQFFKNVLIPSWIELSLIIVIELFILSNQMINSSNTHQRTL